MPPKANKPVPVQQGPVLSSTYNLNNRNLAIGSEPGSKNSRHWDIIIQTELTKITQRTWQEL